MAPCSCGLQSTGGNHRNLVRLYVDGNEVDSYGQWGNPQNINTVAYIIFKLVSVGIMVSDLFGSIDDVRLYSVGFQNLKYKRLVREASGLPLDLGEKVTLFLFRPCT